MTFHAKVRCSVVVEVDLHDVENEATARYLLEEHSCPGTGIVGSHIECVMASAAEGGYCWACRLQGRNEIIELHEDRPISRPPSP